MNPKISQIANSILKESVDIDTVDPKIQHRIMEVKKIYQKIKAVQDTIDEQVATLEKQKNDLEKQTKIFEKEIMPTLKTLEDHCIQAEGILVQLKAGKRSPKVGYEFLATRVESSLMAAAEEAITKAAEFAHGMTVTVSSNKNKIKTAGIMEWLKARWDTLKNFVFSLKKKTKEVKDALDEFERSTALTIDELEKAHQKGYFPIGT